MSESNKILDVTYGTFSCRLEGFDDSVETMKTVVGYFHDLHGVALFTENSHPMPDPDALARLAARGGNGEVVVEQDENGISLRVMTDEIAVPVVQEATADEAEDDVFAALPEDDEPAAEQETSAGVDADDDGDEFAATDVVPTPVETIRAVPNALSARIAALTAAQRAQDTPKQEDTTDAAEVEGKAPAEVAETVAEPSEPDADLTADGNFEPEDVTPQQDIDDLRVLDGAADEDTGADDVFDADADHSDGSDAIADQAGHDVADEDTSDIPENPENNDSVVDKLQRIRAVTDRGAPMDAEDDDDFAEDIADVSNVVKPKPANPLAQRLADMAKRKSNLTDDDEETSQAATETKPAPLMLDEPVRADRDDAEPEPEAKRSTRPLLLTPEGAVDLEDADATGDEVAPEARAQEDQKAKPELLILTDRTDPVDTPAAEDAPAVEREEPVDEDFDLQEEVAKIERELASRPGNEVARHGLPRSVEDAMSRIMDRTDLHLDMEETRDGRDAFAQLKAAVAATEAARQLGDNGAMSRDVSEAFRDDLGALEQGEGKSHGRGAPLRLVPDSDDSAKSTLREVAPLNEAASRLRDIAEQSMARAESERERTFVDFVKEHSPADLAEELEAAAAYLNLVDDELDLSRPQLIRLVQTVHNDEITREDGLRSFGRLLRQGRVVKQTNGRFRVADSTRFRPSGGKAANG